MPNEHIMKFNKQMTHILLITMNKCHFICTFKGEISQNTYSPLLSNILSSAK